jgi:hypothetical protein
MFFRNWLKLSEEKFDDEKMFSQRDITQKSNVGKLLGFSKPLVQFSQGSLATLYQHPTNKNLLIKVTSHKEDIDNIVMAQKLNSPNVVKAFPWDKKGKLAKEVPSLNSFAIIVEKIKGVPMIYTTSEFFDLSLNGEFELAADWLDSTVHKAQEPILDHYNKNNPEEHMKLSGLFRTLSELERYRVELSDIQDNILDTGSRYVIVDMGF